MLDIKKDFLFFYRWYGDIITLDTIPKTCLFPKECEKSFINLKKKSNYVYKIWDKGYKIPEGIEKDRVSYEYNPIKIMGEWKGARFFKIDGERPFKLYDISFLTEEKIKILICVSIKGSQMFNDALFEEWNYQDTICKIKQTEKNERKKQKALTYLKSLHYGAMRN